MMESSRTVESCLSFYHLKCMKNRASVKHSHSECNSELPCLELCKVHYNEQLNETIPPEIEGHVFTCKSGVLDGVNSLDNFTWKM